jgi:alpha-mannosidase
MATLTLQQKNLLTRNRTRNNEPNWVQRIDLNGKVTGVFADYHYVGTGDIGGATQEFSVKML